MMDERFFRIKKKLTLHDACELVNATSLQDPIPSWTVNGIASLGKAEQNDIAFFGHPKYIDSLKTTRAGACLMKKEFADKVPESIVPIIVQEPYYALSLLLEVFYEQRGIVRPGISTYIAPTACVSSTASIGNECYISDGVVIQDNCVIKDRTIIGPNTTIHTGVEVGEGSTIDSNVSICCAIIGENTYIKSGAQIGQPGFGFFMGKVGPVDILQIGKVIIGKNVQIGANCTIDRGGMEDTIIGDMVRIDNMVHIAHNVHIGNCCFIAAQCGIAGSTVLGDGCVLGGQVGVAGHLTIKDKVTVAAKSGVMRDTKNSKVVGGIPATNISMWHRQTIAVRKLAQKDKTRSVLIRQIYKLGKKVIALSRSV